MLKFILLAALLWLTSCGVLAQTPPDKAIELAITQTLADTQQTLAQDLNLNASKPNFKIQKVDVKSREKISSPSFNQYAGEVYRVRGTFDTTLAGPSPTAPQSGNPFDIYLSTETQDTDEIETWFLLHPEPTRP